MQKRTSLSSIGRISKCSTNEKIKLLVNAVVIKRVDYCNSTLYGLPNGKWKNFKEFKTVLQQVLLLELNIMNTLNHALRELHWLPFESRIIHSLILLSRISSLLTESPPRDLQITAYK